MQVEALDAHVGRRGRIRVKGHLPLTAPKHALPPPAPEAEPAAAPAKPGKDGALPAGIGIEAHGLELRVRNVYTGARHQHSWNVAVLRASFCCPPSFTKGRDCSLLQGC